MIPSNQILIGEDSFVFNFHHCFSMAIMPDPNTIKQNAALLKINLVEQQIKRKWQDLSFDELRQFLQFLFGLNPLPSGSSRQTDLGISVERKEDKWHVTFAGQVKFCHDVIDGKPVAHALQKKAETAVKAIKRVCEKTIKEAEKRKKEDLAVLKPYNNYQ